jgi:transcriptional regulator with XRE-family HTH domain
LAELVGEGRQARVSRNLSQKAIGQAIGLSDSRISLIERGDYVTVPFVVVARYLSAVGLELSARAYPIGLGVRDAAQLELLARLRRRVSSSFVWHTEVPMPIRGDLRAWDAGITRDGIRIGVDAETRLRDAQAVDRRVTLKLRDSAWDRAILLLAATRSNRLVLREFGSALQASFPVSSERALEALEAGQDPGGNAVIVL